MKLEYFGTDEFKDCLVVFYIDRGENPNAYVWVYEDGTIRVTGIYAVASYCNHSVSPFYVKDDVPQEFIDRAYEHLRDEGEDKLKHLLDEFIKEQNLLQQTNERDYAERKKYEDGVISHLKVVRNSEDGMLWLM